VKSINVKADTLQSHLLKVKKELVYFIWEHSRKQ